MSEWADKAIKEIRACLDITGVYTFLEEGPFDLMDVDITGLKAMDTAAAGIALMEVLTFPEMDESVRNFFVSNCIIALHTESDERWWEEFSKIEDLKTMM